MRQVQNTVKKIKIIIKNIMMGAQRNSLIDPQQTGH